MRALLDLAAVQIGAEEPRTHFPLERHRGTSMRVRQGVRVENEAVPAPYHRSQQRTLPMPDLRKSLHRQERSAEAHREEPQEESSVRCVQQAGGARDVHEPPPEVSLAADVQMFV